jgi:thiol-disulfide isomerase/thioredoxin
MRRLASLVVSLVVPVGLMLAMTGCTSLQGTGDKGYVTGDGAIRTFPVSDRDEAISLSGKDLDGKPLSLESMRGKPTVVTVWGSWCASCRKDSPYLV